MATVDKQRRDRVHQAVVDQCELVLASDAFETWKGAESLQPGDVVACNNSFLFREGRSTTKSPYYLGIGADGSSNFSLPPVVLTVTGRINSQFKRLAAKELPEYDSANLIAAIDDQLPRLGSIVFSLAGRIGEPEAAEVALVGVPGVQFLRYAPDQSNPAGVHDGVISIGNVIDLDASWNAVESVIAEAGEVDTSKLSEAFEAAFHALQEATTRPVDPADITEDGPSILASVIARMEEQVSTFTTVLKEHQSTPQDNDIYNELLRVAYNFADGARAFLGLMVGVCDLKPVLFWLTVFEQVDLAHRFARLPFSLVGKGKPSLERYRSVIADARNQAFHDLFAFDHPFRVRLPGDALRSPELRLFREYAKRNDPALSFEDRGLVELFAALTRTPERPVPVGFWQGNAEVMTAVVEAVRALRRSMIIVAA